MNRIVGPQPASTSTVIDGRSIVAAALSVDRLYRPADLSTLSFQTTSEIEPIEGPVGQQRAVDAIGFGTRVRRPGFNLFVIGSTEARREPLDMSPLLTHLAHLNERLAVMSRAAVIDRGAAMIASLRGVPVLLTEPTGFRVQRWGVREGANDHRS